MLQILDLRCTNENGCEGLEHILPLVTRNDEQLLLNDSRTSKTRKDNIKSSIDARAERLVEALFKKIETYVVQKCFLQAAKLCKDLNALPANCFTREATQAIVAKVEPWVARDEIWDRFWSRSKVGTLLVSFFKK